MAHFNPIRPITQRLNSTPAEDLPRYAGLLAASILSSAGYLRSLDTKRHDASVQAHKLVTRVSSLLQDRNQEARFTGIVLVKALAEAVGPNELANSGLAWVRSLLSCLNKSDPVQSKRLSIIAVTRIFLLTYGNQAMVREITTPSLPAFMTACLNAIKPAAVSRDGVQKQVLSSLLQPVLQCWVRLIRCFPSTIRPFTKSIRAVVLSLISQENNPEAIKQIAQQVFAALHYCAPKDTAAAEWTQSVRLIIESAHHSSDFVFRSVVEEWSPSVPGQTHLARNKKTNSEVHTAGPDPIGMDKWTGLQAGCSRTIDLLRLLSTMLVSGHAQTVSVHLTEILDLCARCAAIPWPSKAYSLRENKEIPQEERDELYTNLVRIHSAVLELHEQLADTFGRVLAPVSQRMLSQLWDIFEAEATDDRIRESVYKTMTKLLVKAAAPLLARDSEHIAALVRACCQDLSTGNTEGFTLSAKSVIFDTSGADSKVRLNHDTTSQTTTSSLSKAAWELLPVILQHVPAPLLTGNVRAELDRTAILVGHEAAMLASVMHSSVPRQGTRITPSILPFLARSAKDSLALEALIRPRMPVIRVIDRLVVPQSPDAKEDDEVIPQNGSDTSDANLHDITNHVTQQIESATEADEASDMQAAKKRDFATIEEVASPATADSSKRVKPESALFNSEDASKQLLDDLSGAIEIEMETDIPGYAYREQDSSHSADLTNVSEELRPTPQSGTGIIAVVETLDDRMVYDSDDSEIPQIDTALSSDEEGDVDEDEDED